MGSLIFGPMIKLFKGLFTFERYANFTNNIVGGYQDYEYFTKHFKDDNQGSKPDWVRCNESLSYTEDVFSTVNYHRNLIKKGYHILIYSGDHDMVVPYISTHTWIDSLNLTISNEWEPWFVDGQVAGYTVEYTYKKSILTFATVKARLIFQLILLSKVLSKA
jgi:hypothetical protein